MLAWREGKGVGARARAAGWGWERGRRIPTFAARCIFNTFAHSATAAPELSITFSIDWETALVLHAVRSR